MFSYFREGRLRDLILSGLFFGLGAATKWLAIYGAPGLCFIYFWRLWNHRKDKPLAHLLTGGVSFTMLPMLLYYLSFTPILATPGHGFDVKSFFSLQRFMYNFHLHLETTRSYSSRWWSWLMDLKPIWYYTGKNLPPDTSSMIVLLGNPVLFWGGIAVILYSAYFAYTTKNKNFILLITAFLSLLLPWIFISRMTFIYHIFPATPFLFLLTAYFIDKYKKVGYRYLILAGIVFAFFYPAMTGAITPYFYGGIVKLLLSH
jgi:dolichyl-phosphate-mannose--protein O-mannosyl transferase